jgi:tripartite-type tricarboxylate transporter receptor subunit TctC
VTVPIAQVPCVVPSQHHCAHERGKKTVIRILGRLAAMFFTILGSPASAAAAGDFFSGRTIYLQVGFGPGGENDIWARAIATHLGDHLQGHARVVVQNAPGAGGLKLMNQLYNASPKDGTVIGLINRGIPFEPLLGGAGVQFDPLKMNWLGSPDRDTTVCVALKSARVKEMRDLFTKELVVGATGSGADTAVYPEFLFALLGMKFRVVKGYQGTKDISLAMERGEVEGLCVAYDSLLHETPMREGRVSILFQAALKADPRLPRIPVATDLARSQADREALALFFGRVELGRPLVLPPGVPVERVRALREALRDTIGDPRFVEDSKRQGLNLNYINGEQLAATIAAAYRAPKAVIARTKAALGRSAQ